MSTGSRAAIYNQRPGKGKLGEKFESFGYRRCGLYRLHYMFSVT